MSDNTESTKVTKVEVSAAEMNELLDLPGAESVMLPDEENKPSFFSKDAFSMDFIDKPAKKNVTQSSVVTPEEKSVVTNTPEKVTTTQEEIDVLNTLLEETQQGAPTEKKSGGRPQVVKEGTVELAKKLIEKGTLIPFDDDKKIEDYTLADFEELLEANIREKENEIREKTPLEFFDSLPQELQYAAKYVADGGTDMKGLFRALADVQETYELSTEDPDDQEAICRQYLQVTNFGSAEDIEEEISAWKDREELDKKAEKFKPRLDKMKEEQVAYKVAQQEQARRQQIEASQKYANSVYEVLKPASLNGLKLDKRTQEMLYSGLIQPQYPSISGRSTNLFGHLIEKYQFVEPNHSLIAEALWLLADPEGYKSKVKEMAKVETTENIVRKLKTEESRKIGSSPVVEKEETFQKKIPRNNNFFKR
jgi:hypothetical protein